MLEDRILVVDDDPSWQDLLRESIESVEGPGLGPISVTVVGSYAEAAALLDRQHFHLAFVDLRLREDARELDGKKLARQIAEQDEGTSVVIATGHADVSTAITALKEWKVLDFVLKDAWEPGKVAELVLTGIPRARAAYASRYESAIEFLRGERETYAWVAGVLSALALPPGIARPERRLGDFLSSLLDGLYPLLLPASLQDAQTAFMGGCYWSKALGLPVEIRFGRKDAIEPPASAFVRAERVVADDVLGVRGVVCVPAAPPFAAFSAARQG
jgi:ActR/RegA family two-component response regulator